MIVFHRSFKRSLNYINSIQKLFEDKCSAIDGIIELFNNCDVQGFVIKILSTYNSKNDLAVWVFESLKDKNIKVGYSTISNVNENNSWIDEKQVNFKSYPIISDIKSSVVMSVFENIKDYYNLNEEIEMTKNLPI